MWTPWLLTSSLILLQSVLPSTSQAPINDIVRTSRNISDIRFLLYTRQNRENKQILKLDDPDSIRQSYFSRHRPTKVLVHGFRDKGTTSWILHMKNEYLMQGDMNVISVDWEKLAGDSVLSYITSVANTRLVGPYLASLIELLVKQIGSKMESIHLIGFSLGAHVVGIAGYTLKGQLPRITGLDPTAFFFLNQPCNRRLCKSNAAIVDVIHTAGFWISIQAPVGLVDYYPNSGQAHQPGCQHESAFGLHCSHLRAPAYFSESINSRIGFYSVQCPSWRDFEQGHCHPPNPSTSNLMGDPVDASKPGIFFLETRAESPYAIPRF